MDTSANSAAEQIYQAVRRIPGGSVATYGDVAAIVGGGCDARTVGEALRDLPRERLGEVPWHRVINSSGRISTRGPRQRALLEAEGIAFDERGRVDLARYRWDAARAGQRRERQEQPRLFEDQ